MLNTLIFFLFNETRKMQQICNLLMTFTMPVTHFRHLQPLKFGNGKVISPTLYNVWDYLSMPGLKLIHINKRGPGILSLTACRPLYSFKHLYLSKRRGTKVNSRNAGTVSPNVFYTEVLFVKPRSQRNCDERFCAYHKFRIEWWAVKRNCVRSLWLRTKIQDSF